METRHLYDNYSNLGYCTIYKVSPVIKEELFQLNRDDQNKYGYLAIYCSIIKHKT